jgi:serine/threonine protein kinase
MAPEQAQCKIDEIDEQTDIYALGGILYEILTLEKPVQGRDFNELLANIIKGVIRSPAKKDIWKA